MADIKYNTNQREDILKYLIDNRTSHITVDDVSSHLKTVGTPVGRATIYRYFDILIGEGRLRKFEVPTGKSACYQYIDGKQFCHEHYHFICDECKELFHTECEYLDEVYCHLREKHGFYLNRGTTILHGICQKCSNYKEETQ